MSECPHCRDWGKYEKHEDHWPPSRRRHRWWSPDEQDLSSVGADSNGGASEDGSPKVR